MRARSLLLLPLVAVLIAAKAGPSIAPPPPALGWDWIDDRTPTPTDPDPWPNADASAAGLDDMIHDERLVGGEQRVRHGLAGRLDRRDAYIVLPVLRRRF